MKKNINEVVLTFLYDVILYGRNDIKVIIKKQKNINIITVKIRLSRYDGMLAMIEKSYVDTTEIKHRLIDYGFFSHDEIRVQQEIIEYYDTPNFL